MVAWIPSNPTGKNISKTTAYQTLFRSHHPVIIHKILKSDILTQINVSTKDIPIWIVICVHSLQKQFALAWFIANCEVILCLPIIS